MKIIYLFVVLTIFGCSKNESKTDPAIDLNGEWVGKGYQCPAGTFIPEEIVKIVHRGDSILATKVTGDDCVPAGEITFQGNYNPNKDQFDIIWNTGNPWNPVCCTSEGTLKVSDKNTINSFLPNEVKDNIFFSRK